MKGFGRSLSIETGATDDVLRTARSNLSQSRFDPVSCSALNQVDLVHIITWITIDMRIWSLPSCDSTSSSGWPKQRVLVPYL